MLYYCDDFCAAGDDLKKSCARTTIDSSEGVPPPNRYGSSRIETEKIYFVRDPSLLLRDPKIGFWALRGARMRTVASGGARKSCKWARMASCTVATGVLGTPPKSLKFAGCRFSRQGRGIWAAPHGRWPEVQQIAVKLKGPEIRRGPNSPRWYK